MGCRRRSVIAPLVFAACVQIGAACLADHPPNQPAASVQPQDSGIVPVYLESPEFDSVAPLPKRKPVRDGHSPLSPITSAPDNSTADFDALLAPNRARKTGLSDKSGIEKVGAENWPEPAASIPQAGPEYAPSIVPCPDNEWTSQYLPDGLMFHSFLAGEKEPRFASVWLNDPDRGMIWETALGARLGIWRYGTQGAVDPNGWQLDLEGGVLTRLDWEEQEDVDAADFVVGILMTRRIGPTAIEFGYSHISSHVGDEYLAKHPGFLRINYVRDSVLFGLSYDVCADTRVYGEVAYAPGPQGGAEPLEIQTGAEYSPARPNWAPFAAVNLHYREDFGFQASVNVVAGCQLRSAISNRLFRIGLQHYNGKSLQYSFFDENEQLTGGGLWVDF